MSYTLVAVPGGKDYTSEIIQKRHPRPHVQEAFHIGLLLYICRLHIYYRIHILIYVCIYISIAILLFFGILLGMPKPDWYYQGGIVSSIHTHGDIMQY